MKLDATNDFLKKLQSELNDYSAKIGPLPEALKILYENLNIVESLDVDADIVKLQVYNTLSILSGIDIHEITDNSHLKFDLGLNQTEKWILKRKFNDILKNMGSTQFVTRAECSKLEYVSNCLKLVHSKLN